MRSWDDEGNALVEFVYLAVLLMVPLVYVMITVFLVQAAAFGTTEAARQAARAFARADSVDDGRLRAEQAATLALKDHSAVLSIPPDISCQGGPCLAAGSRVRVTVTYRVKLPVLGALFGAGAGGTIPVSASHTEYVDRFKAP